MGSSRTIRTAPITATATTILPTTIPPHGHRNVYISALAATRGVLVVQSMTTPVKSSPACEPSAAAYPSGPPLTIKSGSAQSRTPPIPKTTAVSLARGVRPGRGRTSAAIKSGAVSRTVCTRTPAARPATKAPATSIVSNRRSARPVTAKSRRACAPVANASPVISLKGRRAVNQNKGEATAIAIPHQARRSVRSNARHKAKSRTTSAAPASTLHMANAAGATWAVPPLIAADSFDKAMYTGYPGGCG